MYVVSNGIKSYIPTSQSLSSSRMQLGRSDQIEVERQPQSEQGEHNHSYITVAKVLVRA